MYERYLKLYRSPLHRDAWTNYKSFKRRRPIAMSNDRAKSARRRVPVEKHRSKPTDFEPINNDESPILE